MTREQFLNDLRSALTGMKEEEKDGVIAYYSEMIDDRIEAGMTEEAAVKAMEPVREIASRVLEEAGVGDQKPAAEEKDNRKEIRRPAETGKAIRIQAECKRVHVYSEEDLHEIVLRYSIGTNDIFQLHEDDGTLTLEHKLRPMSSFMNEKGEEGISLDSILNGIGKFISSLSSRIVSGVSYESAENEIEILLPKTYCGKLEIGTSNARVCAEGLNLTQSVMLTTSNARIEVSDVNSAGGAVFTTSNSRIVLSDVNAASAHLVTSNGKVELNDVYIRGSLNAVNSNGSVTADDTVAEGSLVLTSSNGGIRVKDTASPDITLKTSNGGVSGTIKGVRADYTIVSRTSNAGNSLGNQQGGEKRLQVITSNGGISLEFAE